MRALPRCQSNVVLHHLVESMGHLQRSWVTKSLAELALDLVFGR